MRRSARSINVCERTDGLWGLPPEVMCRVQRGKTWYSGSAGVYCRRTRVKMESWFIRINLLRLNPSPDAIFAFNLLPPAPTKSGGGNSGVQRLTAGL